MDVEKKIPLIKKKFFLFALVTTSWNCKKCSTSKIFRCKFCVKSNFANVNAHILLFSFITNYEDGQNRIMQSLKPTRVTAWKTSKYRVFSGPYFPAFGLNTEIYSVNLRIQSEYRKIRTRKNTVFGHFSRGQYKGQWTKSTIKAQEKYVQG